MSAFVLSFASLSALADPPHDGFEGPTREWTPHARQRGRLPRGGLRAGTYVPLRDPDDRPSVTVYGYWPYWSDPLSTVPWDQLTHLAIFDVGTDGDGNLTDTGRWTSNADDAVLLAAPYGVRVHLCLTSFDDAVMASVLTDPSARSRLIDNLRDQVDAFGADGVNVDFEGLDVGLKTPFVTFLQELRAEVDEVFVAMPAVDWAGAYDYDQIALATDGLFVMGYDYHWAGGDPGPVSPLFASNRWGDYSLEWTLEDYRTWGAPDDTILMGLPLYGQEWPTVDRGVPGQATGAGSAVVFSDGLLDLLAHGRSFDAPGDTPYTFPSATRQEWVDDAESLGLKADWAVSEGVQGIGFWALGYDDGDLKLWSAIDAATHPDGIQLSISPGIAGQINTWTVTGARSNRTVEVYAGPAGVGASAIAGCDNALQLGRARLLASGRADASGRFSFQQRIPAGRAGVTRRYQAVATASCKVSPVLVERL